MTVYAFDVDHTLEVSGGPVRLAEIGRLAAQGHIVGLCGNWAAVTLRVRGWERLFSFIGPMGIAKAEMLTQLRTYIPADDFVLVGNDPEIFGGSEDKAEALRAGWRFLREAQFAAGQR